MLQNVGTSNGFERELKWTCHFLSLDKGNMKLNQINLMKKLHCEINGF